MSGNRVGGGFRHGHNRGYRGGWNDVAYCEANYRSYDPITETYLGLDGVRHFCE